MTAGDESLPLYERVRRAILAEIDCGARPPGSFLPSESELCASHSVSRVTLRRAISELCAEGRLIRQQGRGTLVAPRKLPQRLISISGFSEVMDGLGIPARHIVLAREDRVDPAVATRLGATAPLCVRRLLEADGCPLTLEALHFDAARFPDILAPVLEGGSFFAALRQHYGRRPGGAERRIDVGFATAPEAEHLGITRSQPVYRIEKTVLDDGGAVLALSHLVTPCHLVTLSLRS